MRSDRIKKGYERAPHRSLLKATGIRDEDFDKPFIAIANSHVDIIPGHVHLNEVGRLIKAAVREAGGVPFVFNTIGVDDGIAMGHEGMKYSLPSRELIADCLETMINAHCFDGLICIPNCDKIVPGMLMGAMRCNIPTIFVSGGPMKAGVTPEGEVVDLISVFSGVAAYKQGTITAERLKTLEDFGCPTCGSCSGMFTANSMNCLCEALGMALPGNGTILAVSEERGALYRQAARQILELVRRDIKARDIVTLEAIDNALILDMAMGGSTNTILHTLAIARDAGIEYDLGRINDLAERTPNICKVAPSSHFHVEDVHQAGGVSAILHEIAKVPGLLHSEAMTVTGRALGENIAGAAILNPLCIRPLESAYSASGGLSILYGNLAPEGAVVKTAGVLPEMMVHRGPARIYESQEASCAGILGGEVKPGDVVVIRYEGPKGGPGMQEMLSPTSYIKGMGLDAKVALITDGRFSGGTSGASIGHISPEAALGGTIALLEPGDMIRIDIPARRLEVELTEAQLAARRAAWRAPQPRYTTGWLARYASMATSASTGAVLKLN